MFYSICPVAIFSLQMAVVEFETMILGLCVECPTTLLPGYDLQYALYCAHIIIYECNLPV
jgi:hypothetical protein